MTRDDIDRQLLRVIQRRVPLVREPFDHIAAELGCKPGAVIDRIKALRAPGGVIREISGIFDAAALGYDQALVAMCVPACSPQVGRPGANVDPAGQAAAAHPGVSHCYGRDHRWNLWFTLAVSPRSALGLAATAQRLARLCGAEAHMLLPSLKRYKLEVRFGDGEDSPPPASPGEARAGAPDETQRRALRALQVDRPARSDPFSTIAAEAGIAPDDLLVCGADFLAAGWMRRYAAVLHHRAAGAKANVMVAWRVDPGRADAAGTVCAGVRQVSHCYLRPTTGQWEYGLYTMIHGASAEECKRTVESIRALANLDECEMLWTKSEYRKQRIRLFTDAEEEWEKQTGGSS